MAMRALGSAFAALAARKLRPSGVVALVLPFTAINGSSWAKFRELIATQYTDVTIVSIAANGYDMSFSSDTGMAECLIIGRKIARDEKPKGRGTFISLQRKPNSFVNAQELSRVVLSSTTLRQSGGWAVWWCPHLLRRRRGRRDAGRAHRQP